MSEEYFQLNGVSHMSVEEIWHYFHDNVMNSVNKHVPSKVLRLHLPWLTVPVKCLIRKSQEFTIELGGTKENVTGRNIKL